MTENTNESSVSVSADFVSAANLAYLGDCVYELYVREYLVRTNCQRPSVESLKYVTAHVQSSVVEKILPMLTPEEEAEFKRGRNIGHSNIPKSSTAAEYRRATGLEALFGWLYLTGQHERLRKLFDAAFAPAEAEPEENN
ncbi:MAG: ribonuclease III [Clostridia bacterium]|nr:ribonuclease III [Clostridia bacterium]MBQ9996231.1 ribonuclease III [Clostridia bacterium]